MAITDEELAIAKDIAKDKKDPFSFTGMTAFLVARYVTSLLQRLISARLAVLSLRKTLLFQDIVSS